MTSLNVIDLDNTLVPYDTLFKYVILKIKTGDLRILIFTLLRKLRIINKSKYSQIVFRSVAHCDKHFLDHFIREQYNNVDVKVINIIRNHSLPAQNTINVVCSASPSNYVKPIAELLGFTGIGSEYINGIYTHMYGGQKKNTIFHRYPKSEFIYNFAISDSKSDLDMLLCFNEYQLYSKQ
jgi:phosphoserine phosphatase